jgi:crotonobetainyl-CoA:carnitine CoA-transferase CaiB-like acyl-CoA transferase
MANRKRKWRSFRSARKYIRALGLKNDLEWRAYCKGTLEEQDAKPKDIPTTPSIIYHELGWKDLGDWLGTANVSNSVIRQNYRGFKSARAYVRKLHLKNRDEWQALYQAGKVPKDIPLKPERVYVDKGWVSCGDWLGTGYVPPGQRTYKAFRTARTYARQLKLKSRLEWEDHCQQKVRGKLKLPSDIPATPARIYKEKGWAGWPDWLGKK